MPELKLFSLVRKEKSSNSKKQDQQSHISPELLSTIDAVTQVRKAEAILHNDNLPFYLYINAPAWIDLAKTKKEMGLEYKAAIEEAIARTLKVSNPDDRAMSLASITDKLREMGEHDVAEFTYSLLEKVFSTGELNPNEQNITVSEVAEVGKYYIKWGEIEKALQLYHFFPSDFGKVNYLKNLIQLNQDNSDVCGQIIEFSLHTPEQISNIYTLIEFIIDERYINTVLPYLPDMSTNGRDHIVEKIILHYIRQRKFDKAKKLNQEYPQDPDNDLSPAAPLDEVIETAQLLDEGKFAQTLKRIEHMAPGEPRIELWFQLFETMAKMAHKLGTARYLAKRIQLRLPSFEKMLKFGTDQFVEKDSFRPYYLSQAFVDEMKKRIHETLFTHNLEYLVPKVPLTIDDKEAGIVLAKYLLEKKTLQATKRAEHLIKTTTTRTEKLEALKLVADLINQDRISEAQLLLQYFKKHPDLLAQGHLFIAQAKMKKGASVESLSKLSQEERDQLLKGLSSPQQRETAGYLHILEPKDLRARQSPQEQIDQLLAEAKKLEAEADAEKDEEKNKRARKIRKQAEHALANIPPETLYGKSREEASPATQVAVLAGRAERARHTQQSESSRLLADAKNVTIAIKTRDKKEIILTTRRLLENLVNTQSFDTASNTLFQLLREKRPYLQKNLENQSASELDQLSRSQELMILRRLIQIDNAKGKALATEYFARADLHPRERQYLATMLFSCKYWPDSLRVYLERQLPPILEELPSFEGKKRKEGGFEKRKGEQLRTNRREVRQEQLETLSTIIRELGIKPDKAMYEALEHPGILKGATLEERIAELQGYRQEFKNKTRTELFQMFAQEPNTSLIYYLLFAGEYRFAAGGNYEYETFEMMSKTVNSLPISESKMDEFQQHLVQDNFHRQTAKLIREQMENGVCLVRESERRHLLFARIDNRKSFATAQQRLHQIWEKEFVSLLAAAQHNQRCETIEESVSFANTRPLEAENLDPVLLEVLSLFSPNQAEVSVRTIESIALKIRNKKLASISPGDREAYQLINSYSVPQLIEEHLLETLPRSNALTEWISHLYEVYFELKERIALINSGQGTQEIELELTFLDKNQDFMRTMRCADSATCCFNTRHSKEKERPNLYVTRLNKDPMSFMMDLKVPETNDIVGFVFGRIGIDPQTKRPVIMLNGLYSNYKCAELASQILEKIEQTLATEIHAVAIVLAHKHGGQIGPPDGYKEVSWEIEAMRALEDPKTKKPEEATYDDIGLVANGKFMFKGYGKRLE